MTDDEEDDKELLPPRRPRGADDRPFGPATPATRPELNALWPDDPAVVALTTPMKLPEPDLLPPIDEDDEFVTPLHIHDLANLDPDQVDAKLVEVARATPADDERALEQRVLVLERALVKLQHDHDNLAAFVETLPLKPSV